MLFQLLCQITDLRHFYEGEWVFSHSSYKNALGEVFWREKRMFYRDDYGRIVEEVPKSGFYAKRSENVLNLFNRIVIKYPHRVLVLGLSDFKKLELEDLMSANEIYGATWQKGGLVYERKLNIRTWEWEKCDCNGNK